MTKSAAAILLQGKSVWISKRTNTKSFDGYWQFPGGSVEPNEAIYPDAILREIREETGLDIDASRVEYVASNTIGSHICFIYKIELHANEIPAHTEPDKCTPWTLVPLAELKKYPTIPGVQQLINRTLLKNE